MVTLETGTKSITAKMTVSCQYNQNTTKWQTVESLVVRRHVTHELCTLTQSDSACLQSVGKSAFIN